MSLSESPAGLDRPARAVRAPWGIAMAMAFSALACGVLLGGLSAWFLGSVAFAGLSTAALTFNFHIPAALVRLLAIGRTAARYGERLAGHKAALQDQVARRVALFGAMAAAPGVRRVGWQFGDQARLADYIDDVEDIDYAKLRADLPAATLGVGLLVCLAATFAIAPLAMLPIAALLAAALLVGTRVAKAAAVAWERARALRREGAQSLGTAMASAVPLQAEAVWQPQCAAALGRFSAADRQVLVLRRHQAALDALMSLVGPVAGIGVIGAAWFSGLRAEGLLAPVFLAFAWVALAESIQGTSRILVAHLRRKAAAGELARWATDPSARRRAASRAPLRLAALDADGLQRRAPDGRPIGPPLALHFRAGRPTVLTGASGRGKTSLLKQIAGWIGTDVMRCGAAALDAPQRTAISGLCLHDAAILADTVRANLFAPEASDADIRQALDSVEMTDRIEEAGGLDGWIAQDMLSLGEAQRLNLARAWLSKMPLILLDEPTEHLDDTQGSRILERLIARLNDRIVVLSSHKALDIPNAIVVSLDPERAETD